MKPVGKYSNAVVIDLEARIAARKRLMEQLQAVKDKLDGKETAEEAAARDERKRQRLRLLRHLRKVMSRTIAVLGNNDGLFAIEMVFDEFKPISGKSIVGSEEF